MIVTEPTNIGLDIDAKSLHHEGLETDIKALCHEQVVPQPSLGETPSSRIKQALEGEAVNTNNELSILKCSPVTEAALMLLRQLPVISIQAKYPHQSSDEVKLPRPVAPGQCSFAKLGVNINTYLPTSLGAHLDVPKKAVIWPGANPPLLAEVQSSQPLDEALTTRWPEVKMAISI